MSRVRTTRKQKQRNIEVGQQHGVDGAKANDTSHYHPSVDSAEDDDTKVFEQQ